MPKSSKARGPRSSTLRVFLSYRREDASGHAGRLYDLLAARYGARSVFMDVDAIPLGSEFGETIRRAVASCDVLIAVIGRGWLDAEDEHGRRRLDDPDDFVRREIESALAEDVVVVPAPVQGAGIPPSDALPPSLAALSRRQGFELSDAGWQDDVSRLIRRLEAVAEEKSPNQVREGAAAKPREQHPTRWGRIAGLGGLILVAVVAGVVLLSDGNSEGDNGGDDGSGSVTSSETPVPDVSPSTRAATLGSDLRSRPSDSKWYCTGSGANSDPCTFVLTQVPDPDRMIRAPFDGVVTSWRVREASGPMRLIVVRGDFRPGARSTLERVQGSDEEKPRGGGSQSFPTNLAIQRGDAVALQLSTGAYGNAPYSEGTWLEEWIPPLREDQPIVSDDSSEQTYQLLYNATIERDSDGDGYGDVTQDKCPKDPEKQDGC